MDATQSNDPFAPEGAPAEKAPQVESTAASEAAADGPVGQDQEPASDGSEAQEPAVEKLADKQWTHDATEEVFATKREAVADATAPVAEPAPDPTPPAESAGPTDTPTEETPDELPAA